MSEVRLEIEAMIADAAGRKIGATVTSAPIRWPMGLRVVLGTGLLSFGVGWWGWAVHLRSTEVERAVVDPVAPDVAAGAAGATFSAVRRVYADLREEPSVPIVRDLSDTRPADLVVVVAVPESIRDGEVIRVQVQPSEDAYLLILSQDEIGRRDVLWPSDDSVPRTLAARPLRLPPLRAMLAKNMRVSHEGLLVYAFTEREDVDRALRAIRQRSWSVLDELANTLPPWRIARKKVSYAIRLP